ncbi:MAG: hypothetical protein Q8P83_02600 [bacterium]|nr:hypothetical protein [bacterium]
MLQDKINEVISSNKTYLNDRVNLITSTFALLINIIHWVVLLINIQPTNQKVLLHYNVIYGADLVAQSFFLYLIPGTALVFFLVNFIVSRKMYKKERLASYFINYFSILIQTIFIAATLILININA